MGYNQQYALVIDENFKGRVAMALVTVATYVMNEDVNTADHDQRVIYAKTILNDPMTYVKDYIYLVASNATISQAGPIFSLDGDIDYVVAANFPAKALQFAPGGV